MEILKAGLDDMEGIKAILKANHANYIAEEDKKDGFVTTNLTDDQLRSILDEMIEKKVTPTCPHGRPLVVAITHRELDRKFKRIQG